MHFRNILRLACSSHAKINVKRLVLILESEHNLDDNLHADRYIIFILLILSLFLVLVFDGFFPKLIFKKKKKKKKKTFGGYVLFKWPDRAWNVATGLIWVQTVSKGHQRKQIHRLFQYSRQYPLRA